MFKRSLYRPLIFITIIVLNACSSEHQKKNNTNEKPVAVTVSTASTDGRSEILASGEVEAVQTANISTRLMGRITNIFVKAGDRVNKGQLLATVWSEDIKAKRAQVDAMIVEANSAYAAAQKDYDRFNSLYKQQSATAKELDNITLQYNSAKARVASVKQMRSEVNADLSYSNLIAPFSGIVTQKLSEVGSISNPGMPILTIEQDGVLQVSASVAESDISSIHLGGVAHVQIRSIDKSFDGKIIQIYPSSQFTAGQYPVKISIPAIEKKNIQTGMFASVSFPVKEISQKIYNVVLAPLSALVYRDGLTGIYTVSANNTALLRWIRLGKTYGDKVEVISGLSRDEKFISTSQSKLYNGVPVSVKEIQGTSIAKID
jgi:RND family efflux transporter MFP subunit